MERQDNKYKYSQLEVYKESLESIHIKTKTIIVNVLLFLFALLLIFFLTREGVDATKLWPSLFMIFVIIVVNLLFMSITDDAYNSLHVAMYVTIIGVHVITISLVFAFQTPSIFTSLFLGYAITSIYQDQKGMILSSLMLFFSGTTIVVLHPEFLALYQASNTENLYIYVFLMVFVTLLTLSSFILIKRKAFFYNQIASIKESEVRNIALMNQMFEVKMDKKNDYSHYYDDLEHFSEHLSKKIGVDSLFKSRLGALRMLKDKPLYEVAEKYPEFTAAELEELQLLEVEVNNKMINLATKASKSGDIKVAKKDIFSESQFKSFNHVGDSQYTKIISFAVFYALLKVDKPYLKSIDESKLRDLIFNSEYFYRIDRDIVNIYLENSEVFDSIVNDHLKGGW